ncbi:MAG: CotH kinase family protein [Clostridium sp.]|uniref:CotH kinase family protein n=1 Tax=Clostridium sp. TaxID=1506 RepID=UPI003F40D0AB
MISKKKITLFCAVGMFIIGIFTIELGKKEEKKESHTHYTREEVEEKTEINEDNTVGEDFKTHLPLVIIDTEGKEVKSNLKWNEEDKIFKENGEEPYVKGDIKVIYEEGKKNKITDKPFLDSNMKIKVRGNTSSTFEKKQYKINLLKENGEKDKKNILDMGEDHEWILNISMVDKSLIRNYLGLTLGKEILEYTPEARYCEVLIKKNDKYYYEGVYLLMETVKRGDEGVPISKYDDKFTEAPYILRRDRYDENGIMLNNYGREKSEILGVLEVKYPNKKEITKETLTYIESEVSEIDKSLLSKDKEEFLKYKEYLDEESFIDYFIINEFLLNYDAGYHSTYFYKEAKGKLKAGPVWDFDMSIDNAHKYKADLYTTAMHSAPWFKELLKDGEFTLKVKERYEELRKNELSEEKINKIIDETVMYLGSSIERDRKRWDKAYNSFDEKYNIETKSHEEEINKIKYTLKEHGRFLDEEIDSLYQFSEFQFSENNNEKLKDFLGIGFIILFIVSIILVQRD